VLAGRVSYTVDTYVLGASVWVDVEVYGIVIRSVKVCTLAGGFSFSGLATNSMRRNAYPVGSLSRLKSQLARLTSKLRSCLNSDQLLAQNLWHVQITWQRDELGGIFRSTLGRDLCERGTWRKSMITLACPLGRRGSKQDKVFADVSNLPGAVGTEVIV
jgi:hypothetical protein